MDLTRIDGIDVTTALAVISEVGTDMSRFVTVKPKAVTAAAHKLARLIYTMLTKGEEYTDQGQHYYEERYRERVLRQLAKRAEKLGMQLLAAPQPA